MKNIIISIQPEHNANIESGRKKYEFRTRPPKIKPPYRVFTYEPKSKGGRGMITNEWICDSVGTVIQSGFVNPAAISEEVIQNSCVSNELLISYSNGYKKNVFALHITALKIYDKPRELAEFYKPCKNLSRGARNCNNCDYSKFKWYGESTHIICRNTITRPPQSWQYVGEIEE